MPLMPPAHIDNNQPLARRWPPDRRTLLAGIWFVTLALGSFLPATWKWSLRSRGLHAPLHFLAFAVSGYGLCAPLRPLRARSIRCLVLAGVAFALEALQSALYPIRFEWIDIITDCTGIFAGLLLVLNSRD